MSARDPWMKFYPQDWRADEKLRVCSLAARGLWVEMLALMHRSERYGQLLVNGNAPTLEQLSVLAGASPSEVSALLAELDGAGVFSRTGSGVLYSRRMTRDAKKAKIARENGKSGGNPSLRNKKGNSASVNPKDKAPDKGGDKAQKPEARSQREANASPHANARADEKAWEASSLMLDLCKIARIEPPDPGRNFDKHKSAMDTVNGWIEAGADPDAIRATLTKRCANLRTSPRSLAFFDKAVREDASQRSAQQSTIDAQTDALIDSILERQRREAATMTNTVSEGAR